MLPSKMVQMRFTPTRGFKSQSGSTSQNGSRSHTPSAKHDNDSPDAQPSFISSSISLFGVDDDLDEPFTGRNHFALYMERIARESHGQASTSGSSPELFVRSISAPMTTPVKTVRTSNEMIETLLTQKDAIKYSNGLAVFSEESVTLQTVQETTSMKKCALESNLENENNPLHSPVIFQLNRPSSPDKVFEEETKFETKVSSIVGLETPVQVEGILANMPNKISVQKSPSIQGNPSGGSNLNGEHFGLEIEEKNEVAMVRTPAGSTTTKLGTPLTNRSPNSAAEKFEVVAKSPSTDSGGSRRTSLGSDESRSTPRTRRKRHQLLQPRPSVWSSIQANKGRFLVMFVGTFVFMEAFNLWWRLVSVYSPKETLERDLKEIIFWFIFSCLLILFFVFFRR